MRALPSWELSSGPLWQTSLKTCPGFPEGMLKRFVPALTDTRGSPLAGAGPRHGSGTGNTR